MTSPSGSPHAFSPAAVPQTGFGDIAVAEANPRVQISATYGLQSTDVESLTAAGGATSMSDRMYVCTTSTTVGSYAVVRSTQLNRYRPGQASRYLFTALFSPPVAASQQLAGAFTAVDGLFFGYVGTEFGIMRRQPGAVAIHRLTVTTGSGGAETITVTLNGVAFAFASGGALSTTGLAERIAEQLDTAYTGWNGVTPQAVGATVTFLQSIPATTAGAFTLSSSGTAAGTFATIQAGAPNVTTGDTVWIPQTSWNGDKMDGTGVSGVTLDPTKLNVFRIIATYLGAGPIRYEIMTPDGVWQNVHTVQYPNAHVVPSGANPSLRLGWIAASVGSTSVLVVKGACAAAFREGAAQPSIRPPYSRAALNFTATTTETAVLVLRARAEFGGTVNQREITMHTAVAANETSNRALVVRMYTDAAPTGTLLFAQHTSESAMDYALPSLAHSGTPVLIDPVPGTGSSSIDLEGLEFRLDPNATVTFTVQSNTQTVSGDLVVIWHED